MYECIISRVAVHHVLCWFVQKNNLESIANQHSKDDLNNNYYDIGTGPFTNYLLINNFEDAF